MCSGAPDSPPQQAPSNGAHHRRGGARGRAGGPQPGRRWRGTRPWQAATWSAASSAVGAPARAAAATRSAPPPPVGGIRRHAPRWPRLEEQPGDPPAPGDPAAVQNPAPIREDGQVSVADCCTSWTEPGARTGPRLIETRRRKAAGTWIGSVVFALFLLCLIFWDVQVNHLESLPAI